MDAILMEKATLQSQYQGSHRNSSSLIQDPINSPRIRYGIGMNQISSRNISSAKVNQAANPLQSMNNNSLNSKIASNQAHYPANSNVIISDTTNDKNEDHNLRGAKHQPKISNHLHLPSVFLSERSQPIKLKKFIKVPQLDENSLEQDNASLESLLQLKGNQNQKGRRASKSFLSPANILNSQASCQNLNVGQRVNTGCGYVQQENWNRPTNTRESGRRSTFENPAALRLEENSIGEGHGSRASNCSSSNAKKRVIVFRKLCSRSPEHKIPPTKENININIGNAMKILEQFAVPLIKPKEKLSLSDMITLSKIRTIQDSGIVKRMLHAPSLMIYDLQVKKEESIKCNENLKERIVQWKGQFNTKENKHLIKIFAYFWNTPEGSVSILMEASRKGSIQDILDVHGSIPENCIQKIASSVTRGLNQIHTLLKQPHGEIRPSEVLLDSDYHPKLSPGISSVTRKSSSNQSDFPEETLPHRHSLGQLSARELRSCNSNVILGPTTKPHHPQQLSSDIFDLGYMLLSCALGNLNLYDRTGFYDLSNLQSLMKGIHSQGRQIKNSCCLLHSEQELRKYHFERSLVAKSEEQKVTLKNNFAQKQQDNSEPDYNTGRRPFTLLELLSINNRYSDSFIDFLCNCLQITPGSRLEARSLLDHEFLSSTHMSSGPLMSFSELTLTNKKDAGLSGSSEKIHEEHLTKVIEAVKIVLLNRGARDKMAKYINVNLIEHPQSREYRKLYELANELKMPISKVLARFRNEIFNKDYDH